MSFQLHNRILLQILKTRRYMSTLPWKFSLVGSLQTLAGKSGDYLHGPTADNITKDLDLGQKTCLITGGTSGIGLEMTRILLSRNCKMLMACRNPYAANVVMKNKCENIDRLSLYEANLSSFLSVKNFIDIILKDDQKIDIVLLNAGVFGLPWTLTTDGLETIFQVNFLSQYYLLMNIEKILAPDARVVWVSSESHRNINWSYGCALTLTEEMISLPKDKYTSIRAYNISKLCGILAMHYFGYRWLNSGKSIFCAHPGSFVKTGLCANWWPYEVLYTFLQPFSKTVGQAAATPLYCATSPELKGLSAQYYINCKQYEESDLAKDFQLAVKIANVATEILKERVDTVLGDKLTEKYKEPMFEDTVSEKKTIDEPLMSNYSG